MSDPTKRPEKLAFMAFLVSIVFSALAALLGYKWSHSYLIMAAVIPLGLTVLFSAIAWWHAFLVRREQLEEEEKQRISKEYSRDDLFGDSDATLQMAADAHKAFDKWFLKSLTFCGGLVIVAICLLQYSYWSNQPAAMARNALQAAGISFFLIVFTLFTGSYYNGLSRERGCRFLRPVAQLLLFSSGIFLLAFAVMLLENFQVVYWDLGAAKFILGLLAIIGLEMVFNFVIEFYRPRGIGEEERPLYESRLLALITEPGGIAKNVAHSLDYQFGFKVSETWFYAFIEKLVIPICIVTAITLYMLSCFSTIDASEMGILERFGKPIANLEPGLHVKLPWPIDRIRKFPVEQLQIVSIGYEKLAKGEKLEPDPNNPSPEETMDQTGGEVLVWDKHHYKSETPFLVATVEQSKGSELPAEEANAAPADTPSQDGFGSDSDASRVPVNFLSAGIDVFYRIDPANLRDFAYNYSEPAKLLQGVAYREAVNYYASVDFIQAIGENYGQAQEQLAARIKKAVADFSPPLGVEVEYVAIVGTHPPVDVATTFQNVVSAREAKYTAVLNAQKYASQTEARVQGERRRIELEAEAYALTKKAVASSEARRFEAQVTAYTQQPQVFCLRAYLDMLESVSKDVRKFIISADHAHNVTTINLQEKLRPDISDVDLNAPEY